VLGDRPGQPLGQEARRSLQSLALRRQARADCYEIDRYGRPVCHVHVAGRNLNLAQIERGWGMLPERAEWVRDPASREAEAKARARKTGVWAKPDALHPATWRERCWGQGECSGAES
jgi:endonuclease YncB( thermonuclease family)